MERCFVVDGTAPPEAYETPGGMPWSDLDPIVRSEVLVVLDALAQRA